MLNPKSHDSLFKWLITAFTTEFFCHYFPDIRIGEYTFIDKEFISKYENLKESLKGDLFLAMEVEIDGILQEIVIQIEHQSEKEDISKRVYEYSCYAWLLKNQPVWSIVIYTDEAVWRKPVTEQFWYAFDSQKGKQYHHFDVIKVKAEKSSFLIKKHSLMCKLLALKADDRQTDPEELVYEIYRAAAQMKEQLTNEQLLLIEQWVNFYKKVSEKRLDKIKKEIKMDFVETTITEHVYNQGWIKGEAEGKIEGETEGRKKTAINLLKMGIDMEIIQKATGLSDAEIKQITRPSRD
jgi:predicted transposase/invertase (TIGR01784 family)